MIGTSQKLAIQAGWPYNWVTNKDKSSMIRPSQKLIKQAGWTYIRGPYNRARLYKSTVALISYLRFCDPIKKRLQENGVAISNERVGDPETVERHMKAQGCLSPIHSLGERHNAKTVLSNWDCLIQLITRNRIVLSFKDSPRKPLGRRPSLRRRSRTTQPTKGMNYSGALTCWSKGPHRHFTPPTATRER